MIQNSVFQIRNAEKRKHGECEYKQNQLNRKPEALLSYKVVVQHKRERNGYECRYHDVNHAHARIREVLVNSSEIQLHAESQKAIHSHPAQKILVFESIRKGFYKVDRLGFARKTVERGLFFNHKQRNKHKQNEGQRNHRHNADVQAFQKHTYDYVTYYEIDNIANRFYVGNEVSVLLVVENFRKRSVVADHRKRVRTIENAQNYSVINSV